jgi:hypothetical protein
VVDLDNLTRRSSLARVTSRWLATVTRLASTSTASWARSSGSSTTQSGRKASPCGPCPSHLLQSRQTTSNLIVHDNFSGSRVLCLQMKIGANPGGIYRCF